MCLLIIKWVLDTPFSSVGVHTFLVWTARFGRTAHLYCTVKRAAAARTLLSATGRSVPERDTWPSSEVCRSASPAQWPTRSAPAETPHKHSAFYATARCLSVRPSVRLSVLYKPVFCQNRKWTHRTGFRYGASFPWHILHCVVRECRHLHK